MRLSFLLLSLVAAILVSVDTVQATNPNRLRSGGDARNLKEKNTGTTTKLSAADLTKEERGGLISWMMFQSGKSKKALEKLESMERYGPPHIKRPLRFERLPDGREKVISEKAYQAKLLLARAAAKDVEEAKRWENVKEKLANKVKIMKEKLAKKKKTSV